MKLPVPIARKLLQMLQGETLPSSSLQHSSVKKMVEDGVIQKQQTGKTKSLVFISNTPAFLAYLKNQFRIKDLQDYINTITIDGQMRADLVSISGDSKLKSVRTFKGFLVNSYQPIAASINGTATTIHPIEGSFHFIYDWEEFNVDIDVTIIGIENPENFRYIMKQQHLFQPVTSLFVSRYPYSYDLKKWLNSIPNKYIHFGDFDFAGIAIYLNEFEKYLHTKSSFFIPYNIEELLQEFGNRKLYDKQLSMVNSISVQEPELVSLINLFHKHKKCLEQEVLIR